MMSPPSSKNQRRAKATPPKPAAQATSFVARMKQLKDVEYQLLNKKNTKLLEALSKNANNVNASTLTNTFPMVQNGCTPESQLLRYSMQEYLRVASIIDLAYDSTTHYCGKVIGMGSNEGCQLMPISVDDADDDDNEKEFKPNSNIPPTIISFFKRDIRAVSAGGLHSMALSTNGTPYTWGNSSKGVLGTNATIQEGYPLAVSGFYTTHPDPSNNICEDGQIHQIAAGDVHSLFLSINGNVYQCGAYIDGESNEFSDDDSKKVMDGDTKKEMPVFGFNQKPVHVYQLPKKAIAISASKGYNAAVLEDHSLFTWGECRVCTAFAL